MIETFKLKLISFTEAAHRRIFGHEMSQMMKDFLGHLSWSFFGIFFSSTFLFLGSIIIGRFLGPAEYGKYNLVLAISNIVIVVMFLGFDTTAIKFISENTEEKKINKYMSNSFWAVVFASSIIVIFSFLFVDFISRVLNTDKQLILIAFFVAFFVAFKTLFDSFIKALHKFKYQAFTKIIEGFIFFILVLYLFLFYKKQNYFIFLVPIVLTAIISIFIYGKVIKNRLRKWDNGTFIHSKSYLKLTSAVSFIGIFIGTIDRLFIAKYLGVEDLGIYSAYLMSSTIIIGQLVLALSNVFFPMINRSENKKIIISKIDRLMMLSAIPLIIVVSCLSFMILKIFGSQYGINWFYILCVSIIAFLQILTSFYGAITSSSAVLFKLTSKVYYFKPVFIVILYLFAYNFKNFGLISIFFIMICSYFYDIFNTKIAFKSIATTQ